jgi:hypothetical protein
VPANQLKLRTIIASTIADAEGLDPPTVALIARYVREAGFIQKRGRGPSAASMVVADAANLLIAVNASTSAIGAREVVPIYRDLVGIEYDNEGGSKIGGKFGEALELLIQPAIERKLPTNFFSTVVPSAVRDAFEQGKTELSIGFKKPVPRATIYISPAMPAMPKETHTVPGYTIISRYRLSLTFLPMKGQKQTKTSDRKDYTEIGSTTIFSIAKILRSARKGSTPASGS